MLKENSVDYLRAFKIKIKSLNSVLFFKETAVLVANATLHVHEMHLLLVAVA